MAKRTRVFLLASAAVLVAVLVTGVVARVGVSAVASNIPDELAYVPSTARIVAYADVRQVMRSPFHDRLRDVPGGAASTTDGLEARTGIKLDRDIDRILMASEGTSNTVKEPSFLVARGRFDSGRIEALMRQQGAELDEYRGKTLLSIKDAARGGTLTFAEPGLLVFGTADGVRGALDAKAGAAETVAANRDFMALLDDVDEGTAWTVARFDSLTGRASLPDAVVTQLPPIDWLAASGRVDTGLHALVRAEAHDEQSAQNLRDVVQGFLSLARLQGSREPAYKAMLDSVMLNAQGRSVSLSFDLTPAVLDALRSQGGAIRPR